MQISEQDDFIILEEVVAEWSACRSVDLRNSVEFMLHPAANFWSALNGGTIAYMISGSLINPYFSDFTSKGTLGSSMGQMSHSSKLPLKSACPTNEL